MADETSSTTVPLILAPSTLTEGDMIATLDVLSEQGHLGGGDDKILIKEGTVSVGRPELYSVAARAVETPLRPVPDPDGRTWTRYLVILPFTTASNFGWPRLGIDVGHWFSGLCCSLLP
jgi:hypothetical protein